MSHFSVSETIERPVDEVWSFATDWEQAPRWMNGVDTLHVDGGGPVAAGTKLIFTARGAERSSEIATWEPPHCLALRSVQGGVTATYTYRFEAAGEGSTKVSLDAVCEFTGLVALMGPLIGWMVKRTDSGQLKDLGAAMQER